MSLPYKELPPVEAGAMKTLPPCTGILIVTAFSLLIWACIAGIFIMLWRAGVH